MATTIVKLLAKKQISKELFKVCRLNDFETVSQVEAYFSRHGSFKGLNGCALSERRELETLIGADLKRLIFRYRIPKSILETRSMVSVAYFLMGKELLAGNQMYIFKESFKIFQDSTPVVPSKLASQLNLSERVVRSLSNSGINRIKKRLMPLKLLGEDLPRNYGLDLTQDLVIIDKACAKQINNKAYTSFSPQFLGLLFGAWLDTTYITLGNPEEVLAGNFMGRRHHWKNFYLLRKEFAAAIDVEGLIQRSAQVANKYAGEKARLNFRTFVSGFITAPSMANSESLMSVAAQILLGELGLKLGEDGNLVFPEREPSPLSSYAYEALNILGEPATLREIAHKISDRYPRVFVDRVRFECFLPESKGFTRYKNLFGLQKWYPDGGGRIDSQDADLLRELFVRRSPKKKKLSYWNQKYKTLKAFTESHNRLPKAKGSPEEVSLKGWLNRQLVGLREGKLETRQQELIKQLTENFPEPKRDYGHYWEHRMQEVADFATIHGRLPRPKGIVAERTLGLWFYKQKILLRKPQKFNTGQQRLLRGLLENYPDPDSQEKWGEQVAALKQFVGENDRLPQSRGQEQQLYNWLLKQRKMIEAGKLERRQHLEILKLDEKFGYKPRVLPPWEERFERLRSFVERHSRFPKRTATGKEEKSLLVFWNNQRKKMKEGKLTGDQHAVLENLRDRFPFKKNIHWRVDWDERLTAAKVFFEAHGSTPSRSGLGEEKVLANWLETQRDRMKRGKLDLRQEMLLKEFDDHYYRYSAKNVSRRWHKMYWELLSFTREYSRYPNRKKAKEKEVAFWFEHQRIKLKEGTLSPRRKELMESFFKRFPSKTPEYLKECWYSYLKELEEFVESYQRLPKYSFKEEQDLYIWYKRQLRFVIKGRLDPEQQRNIRMVNERFSPLYPTRKKWEERFEELETFLAAHARLPNTSSDEMDLYRWFTNQVQKMEEGKLDSKKGKLLGKIKEQYSPVVVTWEQRFEEVKAYVQLHSRLPRYDFRTQEEKILIRWIQYQRKNIRKGTLEGKQCRLFNDLMEQYGTGPVKIPHIAPKLLEVVEARL